MVHRRQIDGRTIVLGNQGDLWMNAMTWFDHETGSVWSQPTGEAILGPLAGETLDLLPSTLSSWGEWKERFPDSVALDTFTRDTGFSIEQMAVVVVANGESVALPFVDLRTLGSFSTEVGGEPILLVADPRFDRWAAFSRSVDGETLDLEVIGAEIIDAASGHRWDAALGAPLTGETALDRAPAFSSFGSDYRNFYPDGELILDAAE